MAATSLLERYLERVRAAHRELTLPALRGFDRRPRLELRSASVALFGVEATLREPSGVAMAQVERTRRIASQLDVEELTAAEQYRAIWAALDGAAKGVHGRPEEGAAPRDLAELSREEPRLVLLGDPGSGKTTLLRRFAADLAAGDGAVPILLGLASFAAARRRRPGLALASYLGEGASDGSDGIDAEALQAVFDEHLAAGKAVVLLDGLDEVLDAEERLAVAREIDAFLDDLPAEDGRAGCRAVVTSRAAGYGLAPLSPKATHLAIQPLDEAAIARFCSQWMEALHRSARPVEGWDADAAEAAERDAAALLANLRELRRRGVGDLVSNPLLLSVLVVAFWHGQRALPPRRLELCRLAIEALIDHWRRRPAAGRGAAPSTWPELLPLLAAHVQDSSTCGAIRGDDLSSWLEPHLPREAIEPFCDLLRLEVGLLVERGPSAYGFLHLALQEYLAASWLAGDEAATRIRAHLDDPRWTAPAVMALGLLSSRRRPDEAARIAANLLLEEGPPRSLLPRAAVALAAASSEMRELSAVVVEELVRQLVVSALDLEPPAPFATVTGALAELLAGPAREATERALSKLLRDAEDDAQARTVARLLAGTGWVSASTAAALDAARRRDAPPWPIDGALRWTATERPECLPAPRLGLSRSLRRRPALARELLERPAWRRLILLVYGGLSVDRSLDLDRLHRESAWLTAELRSSLDRGEEPAALAVACRDRLEHAPDDSDAALALVALDGGPAPPSLRPLLERAAAELATAKVGLDALVEPLARRAGLVSEEAARELLGAALEATPPGARRTVTLLAIAERLPVELRPVVLAFLWRRLLAASETAPAAERDPIYNLAVILDTAGALLASPPEVLAESLSIASGSTTVDDLDGALAALGAMPNAFDFARAWALAVLAPLLAAGSRLVAARALADGLSDRLGARALAVERLEAPVPAGAPARRRPSSEPTVAPSAVLLAHEAGLLEGGLDGDALDALVHLQATALVADALAGSQTAPGRPSVDALADAEREGLTPETLPIVLAHLEHVEDLDRQRASLILYGDASVTRRRHGSQRLGAPALRVLARAWLERQEERPRAALPLRWSFEAIEHDDAEVVSELVGLADGGGEAAEEAELLLGDLHAVRGDVWPAIVEGLRDGRGASRRALLRGVTTLLARRRIPDERWAELAPELGRLAGELDGGVLVEGPGAIAEAAMSAPPDSGLAEGAETAATSYGARRVPWSEVLRAGTAELRARLTSIGEARLIGERHRLEVERAASRLAREPLRLWLLREWLDRRLRREVSSFDRDDHHLRDLLAVTAALAVRLPGLYLEGLDRYETLDRRLAETVDGGDRFPSRRAALELLSLGRRLTPHAAAALAAGLDDVAEVQRSAILSVSRYREVVPEALPCVEADLRSPSAVRVYAVARLVTALLRNVAIGASVRQRLSEALTAAVLAPENRRPLTLLVEGAEGRHGRRRRIEHAGRLDRHLHGLWARASGFTDLLPTGR